MSDIKITFQVKLIGNIYQVLSCPRIDNDYIKKN